MEKKEVMRNFGRLLRAIYQSNSVPFNVQTFVFISSIKALGVIMQRGEMSNGDQEKVTEILSLFDVNDLNFDKCANFEEQGCFWLGYYKKQIEK